MDDYSSLPYVSLYRIERCTRDRSFAIHLQIDPFVVVPTFEGEESTPYIVALNLQNNVAEEMKGIGSRHILRKRISRVACVFMWIVAVSLSLKNAQVSFDFMVSSKTLQATMDQPTTIVKAKNTTQLGLSSKDALSPAQKCRLDLEQNWLSPLIDNLLRMGDEMPPLIDWVWDMGNYFLVNLKYHPVVEWNYNAFVGATWVWQDQWGQNHTGTWRMGKKERGQQKPFKASKLIYLDVPNRSEGERATPVSMWATNLSLPVNQTVRQFTYDLRPFQQCDRVESEENKPSSGNQIGMCVRFRGNHHLLGPFIAYHKLIGVDNFWFYVNEKFDLSQLPMFSDVTYVPYNFVWMDHFDKSRTKGKRGKVEHWNLPRIGHDFWQEDAQLQCLYRAKKYGLKWIMTNDIDEYLWLSKLESQTSELSQNEPPLKRFLETFREANNLGALKISSWSFGRHGNESSFPLDIEYTHHAAKPSTERSKLIYHVPVATNIGIHYLVQGGEAQTLPATEARWNHYRRPHLGIHEKSKLPPIRDSSLPDKYKEPMLEWITKHLLPVKY